MDGVFRWVSFLRALIAPTQIQRDQQLLGVCFKLSSQPDFYKSYGVRSLEGELEQNSSCLSAASARVRAANYNRAVRSFMNIIKVKVKGEIIKITMDIIVNYVDCRMQLILSSWGRRVSGRRLVSVLQDINNGQHKIF